MTIVCKRLFLAPMFLSQFGFVDSLNTLISFQQLVEYVDFIHGQFSHGLVERLSKILTFKT